MASIFDQNDETDYLAELTGPGGKYDKSKYSTETEMWQAIAKGKVHADKVVEQRNAEMDQLREDALRWRKESTTQAKLDDLLTRMEGRNNNDTNNTAGEVPPTIDMNKIEELAAQKAIAVYQQQKQAEEDARNLAVVESHIRERFGDNAPTILRDKLNSIGMSADDLKMLAKKSPKAVINALGLSPQPQQSSWDPPSGNSRSDSFKPQNNIRDAVYYEKLRTENPKEYYSEKVSVQRLKDMDHPDFLKRYDEQSNRSF